MVKQYRLIIFILLIYVLRNDLIFAQSIPFLHKTLSAANSALQGVDIVYNYDFPYKEVYGNQKITKCVKAYRAVNGDHAGSIKYTVAKKNIPVLRCREHIRLLRPIKIINQWLRIQSKKHFFPLNIREFNIISIPARITAVRASLGDVSRGFSLSYKTRRVMGIFERHEINIKTYTFKNTKTGRVISIHATPGHPVYVKNKASFIPMDLLSSTDELLNSSGQRIRLLCSAGHTEHCGVLRNSMVPKPVYNLEIEKKHAYFVSNINLLVHNNCLLARKLKEKIPDLVVTEGNEPDAFLRIRKRTDLEKIYFTLREIEGDHMQSDSLAILAVSYLKQDLLPIKKLDDFLEKRNTVTQYDYEKLLGYHFGVTGKKIVNLADMNNILRMGENKIIIILCDNDSFVVVHPRQSEQHIERLLYREKFNYVMHGRFMDRINTCNETCNLYGFGTPIKYFAIRLESRV